MDGEGDIPQGEELRVGEGTYLRMRIYVWCMLLTRKVLTRKRGSIGIAGCIPCVGGSINEVGTTYITGRVS